MLDKQTRGGDAAPIDFAMLGTIGGEMRTAVSLLVRLSDTLHPVASSAEQSAISSLKQNSDLLFKLAQTLEKGRRADGWMPPAHALPAWLFMMEQARSLAEGAEKAVAHELKEMAAHLFTMAAEIVARAMLAMVGPKRCQEAAWQADTPGSYH